MLTATPTLAFGVNLPARIVVIQDYRRYEAGYGYYPISVLEYKQMAGRAGRPKYDKVGEAILIAKTADEADYLMENFVLAKPERIWSRLAVEKILRGHVLATVASDFAHTENGVYEFFGKTFYAYQYDVKAIKAVIAKILKYLYDEQMLYDATGELPEYCVKGQIDLVRERDPNAWTVLLACALFDREAGASREAFRLDC